MLPVVHRRKAGELLAAMEKAKGAAEAGTNRGATRSHDVTASSLADLGITKSQSSRWQKVAAVTAAKFEGYIKETVASGKELTSAQEALRAHIDELVASLEAESPRPLRFPWVGADLASAMKGKKTIRTRRQAGRVVR